MSNTVKIYLGTLSLKSHARTTTAENYRNTRVHLNTPDNLIHDVIVHQKNPITVQTKISPFTIPRRHFKSRRYAPMALLVLSSILLFVGLYSGYRDWQSNRLSATQASTLVARANAVNNPLPSVQTSIAPSTIKPTATAVTGYTPQAWC
jgi:hypothetical protein